MQVILREDVPNLGRSGEIVEASGGYVRNYLLPRGLAVVASGRNVRQLEHEKRVISKREEKLMHNALAAKGRLEGLSVNISKQVGQDEKLFGSVTNKDIAEALAERDVVIDRKKIQIDEPIRSLGVHTVRVSLARDVMAELKVWVVAAE
jgi:large subunit ribosomal protein L9